jgi:hypothetical protein
MIRRNYMRTVRQDSATMPIHLEEGAAPPHV